MRGGQKEPLYRRVNTRTHGVHHGGGEARWARNSKVEGRVSMHAGQRNGLDYTPLYRFLLSKVGQNWDAVHSEAVARLDWAEPIYHLVALRDDDAQDFVRVDESSYWSGLRVNELNVLEKVAPALTLDDMVPSCACCTHTFNGERFKQVFDPQTAKTTHGCG